MIAVGIGLGFGEETPLPSVLTFVPDTVGDATINWTATYSADATHLLINETGVIPAVDDPAWFAAATSGTYMTAAAGTITLYMFAKSAGGVSAAKSAEVFCFGPGLVAAWAGVGYLGGAATLDESSVAYANRFSAWSVSNPMTVTDNTTETTDPLGGNTADKIVTTAGGPAYHVLWYPITNTVGTGPATQKVAMKAVAGSRYARMRLADVTGFAVFDLQAPGAVVATPAGTTATITDLGDGWFDCSVYMPTLSDGYCEPAPHDGTTDQWTSTGQGIYAYTARCVQQRVESLSPLAYGTNQVALTQAAHASQPFARVTTASPGWVAAQNPDVWNPKDSATTLASTDAGLLTALSGSQTWTIYGKQLAVPAAGAELIKVTGSTNDFVIGITSAGKLYLTCGTTLTAPNARPLTVVDSVLSAKWSSTDRKATLYVDGLPVAGPTVLTGTIGAATGVTVTQQVCATTLLMVHSP